MQDDAARTNRQSDPLDPARATACLTALGLPGRITPGDPLPPFFHHLYFWEVHPAAHLGRDGHPRVGGLIPDMGLPRRMWAGGRLEFVNPLRAGHAAVRTTKLVSATRKQGRTGPLGFVTLRHEITQDGQTVLLEDQDLVYREDPDPTAQSPATPKARTDESNSETRIFDTTLLFRYSALTLNGHRIHYDLDYARDVEGYHGLVVHGPLLAQMLMLMAQQKLGVLRHFSFRATAPLMHFEQAMLCWAPDGTCWVRGPDGRQIMTAKAA